MREVGKSVMVVICAHVRGLGMGLLECGSSPGTAPSRNQDALACNSESGLSNHNFDLIYGVSL